MQWPTGGKAFGQGERRTASLSTDRLSSHLSHRRSAGRLLGRLDGPRYQFDLLFTCQTDRDVEKPPLDFHPLIPRLTREAMRVFVKGLVEDADQNEAAV